MPECSFQAGRQLLRAKKKLLARGTDEKIISQAVRRIEELGYIDDAAYSNRRAQLLAGRFYGDYYIRYQLVREGLPEDMAEKAIAAIPEELSEEKRIAGFTSKMKDRRKDLVKVLAGRGFSFDSIYKTLGIYGVDT